LRPLREGVGRTAGVGLWPAGRPPAATSRRGPRGTWAIKEISMAAKKKGRKKAAKKGKKKK
jgi:hypothetical protein